MNLINNVESRIIFRLSQLVPIELLWLLLLGGAALLFSLFLFKPVFRKKPFAKKKRNRENGKNCVPADTAELPVIQELIQAQMGFCVEQDITYIHTEERIR